MSMADYSKWSKILKDIEEEEEKKSIEECNDTREEISFLQHSKLPYTLPGEGALKKELDMAVDRRHELNSSINKYEELSETLQSLPNKLKHEIMIPIGKKAMAPGKLVRTNEVLAHLGDDMYSWQTVSQAQEIIKRKKQNIEQHIQAQNQEFKDIEERLQEVNSFMNLTKEHHNDGIVEIHEEYDENSSSPSVQVVVDPKYLEIENEEKKKEEEALKSYNWDEMMDRMAKLEEAESLAHQAEIESITNETNKNDSITREDSRKSSKVSTPPDSEVDLIKKQGNKVFAAGKYEESVALYTKAIQLDPNMHILYGNRSAAFYHLGRYEESLEDAKLSTQISEQPWAKGLYRQAKAYRALKRYTDAREVLEKAIDLSPRDSKLYKELEEVKQYMKNMKSQQHQVSKPNRKLDESIPTCFTGNILERSTSKASQEPIHNETKTNEPKEEQSKRISRFKSMRNYQRKQE